MGCELRKTYSKYVKNTLKEQAKHNTFQSDYLNPLFLYMQYMSFTGNLTGMHLPSKRKGTMKKKPRFGGKKTFFNSIVI